MVDKEDSNEIVSKTGQLILNSIVELQAAHTILCTKQQEIESMLIKNNEMTAAIIEIIEATRAFWEFCQRWSLRITWAAKKSAVISGTIVVIYHALDVIGSHDVLALVKSFFTWGKK